MEKAGDVLLGRSTNEGDNGHTSAGVPMSAHIASMCLTLITMSVLGACLTRRLQRVHSWAKLPIAAWLLLAIYLDSFLFVFTTALLKDVGINHSIDICDGAILMCLTCYMSTKVLIFAFLSEKAWLVRGSEKPRFQSRLYLFNCFALLLPYIVAIVLSFIWRIGYINEHGTCIIGMQRRAMLPLLIFEVFLNVYLNIQFLLPLRKLSSYKHGDPKMKRLAFRTFIGSCATLLLSLANLIGVLAVPGEPGWVCLMACNADTLLSVLVLQWVTTFDGAGGTAFELEHSGQKQNSKKLGEKPSFASFQWDIAQYPGSLQQEAESGQHFGETTDLEVPQFVARLRQRSVVK